jgi:hypothetical protein
LYGPTHLYKQNKKQKPWSRGPKEDLISLLEKEVSHACCDKIDDDNVDVDDDA